MIMQKCTPNQRNKNNLKDNHLIKTTDAYLTFGEYQNVFLTEKDTISSKPISPGWMI